MAYKISTTNQFEKDLKRCTLAHIPTCSVRNTRRDNFNSSTYQHNAPATTDIHPRRRYRPYTDGRED